MSVSVLAMLNAYLRIDQAATYTPASSGLSSQYVLAGYLGMFFAIAILPIPDYVLVPVFGYLCLLGTFDPVLTFLDCLAGAVLPIEYVSGRLVARPVLMRALPFLRKAKEDVKVAEDWVIDHGKFSIFISTFIPFFYSLSSFAAGTLKMGAVEFLADSAAGFGVRYVFLEYVGYYGVYVFDSSFDYSHRYVFLFVMAASVALAAVSLAREVAARRRL